MEVLGSTSGLVGGGFSETELPDEVRGQNMLGTGAGGVRAKGEEGAGLVTGTWQGRRELWKDTVEMARGHETK